MRRLPAVSGSFYESDSSQLKERILWSFLHPVGPGSLPKVGSQQRKTQFFIVPHAGYIYSGPVAAHSYFQLASEGKPDLIIILGPDHNGLGSVASVWPQGEWLTPLGEVQVDSKAVEFLLDNSDVLAPDERAHIYEHSIEVQLPFIQYFFGSFKFVPISVTLQLPETSEKIAEVIDLYIKESGKDIVVISSSDLNHYDPYDITNKKDEMVIEKILSMDYKGLYDVIVNKDVTVCGYSPIMVSMILASKRGKKANVLKHANSGDTSGDKSAVVGYLAANFN
ncbi:AmmeMemoRadiSam system protein B [Sulfuracidifex metallicus]|uniref:MEMO1 family protein GC250_04930 n=1 Tax=Sulfuracidifex metallicus DSM 6482 = JCM 9184 TaxID=523847 RepID=A0A6A9QII8_SULME|nr:AmmeMemoRadiSam system protein B [Sulfuracidifex metallicus]MUN28796.1 AmmeMemoRadiSam system protein B [Sulfuracidifex metallicus DSM 6482 = JCM 9184]